MGALKALRSGGATAVRGKAEDGIRRATHLAHEGRLFKSLASDAVEDGLYKARRAWRRGTRGIVDYRDEAAHRVRRQPFAAVGAAAGLGAFAGACLLWLVRKSR